MGALPSANHNYYIRRNKVQLIQTTDPHKEQRPPQADAPCRKSLVPLRGHRGGSGEVREGSEGSGEVVGGQWDAAPKVGVIGLRFNPTYELKK